MKKLKTISLLSILFIISACSSSQENFNIKSNKEKDYTYAGVIDIDKEYLASFKVSYAPTTRVSYDNTRSREKALFEMYVKFLPYALSTFDKNKDEFISYTVKLDKEEGTIEIEELTIYKPNEMDPSTTMFMGFLSVDLNKPKTRATDGYYYETTCIGGKNDGKKIQYNGASNLSEAKKLAEKLVDFTRACLDNGGECVRTCRATAIVS